MRINTYGSLTGAMTRAVRTRYYYLRHDDPLPDFHGWQGRVWRNPSPRSARREPTR